MDPVCAHTTHTLELGHGKCDSGRALCALCQGSGSLCLSAGPVTTFMSPKHRESKSCPGLCRECVHGELGRGWKDENKSVCMNNKGKVMVCWISEALPFKRRVSLG